MENALFSQLARVATTGALRIGYSDDEQNRAPADLLFL
jgi:hypothetical protein